MKNLAIVGIEYWGEQKKVTVIISGNLFLLMLQVERMPKCSKSELFLTSDLSFMLLYKISISFIV